MSQVRVSQTDKNEDLGAAGVGGSRLALLSLVIILGGVYFATLLPGVGYSGDTSKFQFLGKILGIPHPTGYPLYLVLNNLFVTLFPPSAALRTRPTCSPRVRGDGLWGTF